MPPLEVYFGLLLAFLDVIYAYVHVYVPRK
jgi:hypothetical protein